MRINERGQVTIPKHLRDENELHPDTEVECTPVHEGVIVRKRRKNSKDVLGVIRSRRHLHPVDRVAGILDKDALGKGVTVDEYIQEVRGR